MNRYDRRDILLSKNQIENISNAKLAIFGLGGVGGYALEVFIRMGFNNFFLCDGDRFSITNLNRQLLSNESNIGKLKTEVAKDRILSINSNARIELFSEFINMNNIDNLKLDNYYIVDMIDDVDAKIELIKFAKNNNLKIISMMGAGNRIDCDFIVSDISKTEQDPLSKVIRRRLKEENIKNLNVIYTKTPPIKTDTKEIGSIPSVVMKAGLAVATYVIKDIMGD